MYSHTSFRQLRRAQSWIWRSARSHPNAEVGFNHAVLVFFCAPLFHAISRPIYDIFFGARPPLIILCSAVRITQHRIFPVYCSRGGGGDTSVLLASLCCWNGAYRRTTAFLILSTPTHASVSYVYMCVGIGIADAARTGNTRPTY